MLAMMLRWFYTGIAKSLLTFFNILPHLLRTLSGIDAIYLKVHKSEPMEMLPLKVFVALRISSAS